MLSKAQNKYIRSLTQQKYRNEYKVFTAEGDKIAIEWLKSNHRIQMIVATADWADSYDHLIEQHKEALLHIVEEYELAAISSLQTANHVLLVVPMLQQGSVNDINEWCIATDNIQDPGNMGTIIRIADWFGIKNVVCSPGSVDVYNPKVVQAAMGGHLRVNLYETELLPFLTPSSLPVFAATLGGESIYKIERPGAGILVIGNESKGISDEIIDIATYKVTIPRMGGAESLNAGVSAGILCALLVGG